MAVGLQARSRKTMKKSKGRKSADPVQKAEPTRPDPAAHVVSKPFEREPVEIASQPHEAPEAGAQGPEAPDAGFGRCTESSDFTNRGRNWS